MNEVIFSHRPLSGVSVAATSDGNRLFFAAALANDGVSRNSVFHPERRDAFSRSKARNILRGRLAATIAGRTNNMSVVFETPMPAREFIARFRETFKPDVEENDSFLLQVDKIGDHTIEFRANASDIINRIMNLANEVVCNSQVKA